MEEFENIDDLVAAMERDEAIGAEWLKPREFAKLIGVSPQLVYYYVRSGKIESTVCLCGSKVIKVESAKAVFQARGREISLEADDADSD